MPSSERAVQSAAFQGLKATGHPGAAVAYERTGDVGRFGYHPIIATRAGKVTWEVRWREGGQRSRNFARKRDAEAFDSDIRRRRRLGDLELLDSGRETLADFAREWWQVYAMESLEPKTRKVYAEMWDKHVLTRLGGLELRRITPEVIERYQAELRAAGLGDASIRKVLAIIQSILQRAVIWRRITANPVAAVRKPPQRRKRAIDSLAPISVERLRTVLLARQRPGDATLISVLAYAGLRPGEALALRWSDVRERTLLVERAVSLGEVKETKTRRIRAVRLLAPLADDLAVWRELSEGDRDSLVFPNRRGQVWTDNGYRYWRRRVFDAAAREANVVIGRPYDLRHAFVSLLLAEGRSVVYVASQAGHAPSMTLDTYAHVIEELETGERVPAEGVIYAARGELVRNTFARDTEGAPTDPTEPLDLQEFSESPLRDSNSGPPPYHPEPESTPDHSSPFVDEDPDS